MTSLHLLFADAPGEPEAVGQSVSDQLKSPAAAWFDGDQENGAALGDVEVKERLACSASACTSTPSRSTPPEAGAKPGSRQWHRWPREGLDNPGH